MPKKCAYVLGINAYDHDVAACLLRDGEIAFAISKERITREKHDTGFYQSLRTCEAPAHPMRTEGPR
jgi:carbamoyltransferase